MPLDRTVSRPFLARTTRQTASGAPPPLTAPRALLPCLSLLPPVAPDDVPLAVISVGVAHESLPPSRAAPAVTTVEPCGVVVATLLSPPPSELQAQSVRASATNTVAARRDLGKRGSIGAARTGGGFWGYSTEIH